ncbi:MAG: DNA polymerase II large subunit [Candidatus Methylarchaceae archaeon HK02M1]|nr:DNA polymerase II large subunit [Candidatus Methylarchaceae archaeon HK02M1]
MIDEILGRIKTFAPFPEQYLSYYETLLQQLKSQYDISSNARSKGIDPKLDVEPKLSFDLADRIENLIKIPGLAKRLRELLLSCSKEDVALHLAEEVALGKFEFFEKEKALELGIRIGLAVMTDGITVAPIQGISSVKIKRNDDDTNYAAIYFAGPIRSAGGTEAAFTLTIADHIRKVLGLDKYRPNAWGSDEVGRFLEELRIYEREVGNFQFRVSDDDIRYTLLHLPVEIDGVETNPVEVVIHRGLKRISTDRVRGGALRVLNDGVIGRSRKLLKLVRDLSIFDWDWLSELRGGQQQSSEEYDTSSTHFGEVISGRPVLSFPRRLGGFRLRYGRCYNTGLSIVGIHPAVAVTLDYPFVVGTQVKLDIPSKAATVAFNDTIEPPIVKLIDESVVKIENIDHAIKIHDKIDRILHLGDILVSFGDFLENNVRLVPSGYVEEWWVQDLLEVIKERHSSINECAKFIGMDIGRLKEIIKDPIRNFPNAFEAFEFGKKLGTPLHPHHLFYWDLASSSEIITLRQNLSLSSDKTPFIITAPKKLEIKKILEKIGIPHRIVDNELIINGEPAYSLMKTLNLQSELSLVKDWKDITELLSLIAHIPIKRKSSIFVGLRIGRPEKAMPRKMRPPVHTLFPVGIKGGSTRDLLYAAKNRMVNVELTNLICTSCGSSSIHIKCSKCFGDTEIVKKCPRCSRVVESNRCPTCKVRALSYSKVDFPIKEALDEALSKVKYRPKPPLKGVKSLINDLRIPEPLEKGILRQKYDLSVYKDGTIRFDATNAVLTHFKTSQISTTVEKLKELGYEKDIYGNPLNSDDQLIEIFIQDVILPIEAGQYLLRTSKFINELLVNLYKSEPYYNAKSIDDLIGYLIVGLAPHTSVGILGRIIGFTDSQVCFAHPYWHAAKRRDCDGDSDSIMLLMDVLLNFSKEFLPAQIGGLMDAPLLLQTIIIPREVDEQAHNLDVAEKYPKMFYEASMKNEPPYTLTKTIDIIKNRLKDVKQFYDIKFTHDTDTIFVKRNRCIYSTLKTFFEKLDKQIELAMKINAVDPDEVVSSVLKTHILPDAIGNMRAYTSQNFRCKSCGKKYRRIPLKGVCLDCGGNLQPTVTRASIEKYLALGLRLSEKFEVSEYMRSRFKIVSEEISSLFISKEEGTQLELTEFFS